MYEQYHLKRWQGMLKWDVIAHICSVFSPDLPDPPQDLELSDLSARSVRLTWTPGNENNSPVTRTILSLLLTHKYRTISYEYSGITGIYDILRSYKLANGWIIWDVPSLQNSLFSMKRTGGDQANGKICPVTQVIRTLWTWICLHLWTTSSEWLPSTVWVRADQAGHQTATRPVAPVSDWECWGNCFWKKKFYCSWPIALSFGNTTFIQQCVCQILYTVCIRLTIFTDAQNTFMYLLRLGVVEQANNFEPSYFNTLNSQFFLKNFMKLYIAHCC